MSPILTLVAIAVGVMMILSVMNAMKKKKMSAAQSILWLLSGCIVIILGIFPSIVHVIADIFGIVWQPAVLLFGAVVILAFICFGFAQEVSVMRSQITELAEQVSVLKYELQEKDILKEETRE